MLFDVTTAPQLRPWLIRTLEPICDAEPGALAEYILALLKHNVPENDMRRELTAQLDEFLEKECTSFIDTLFMVLRTKTYLPYNTDSTPKQPRAMDTGIPIPLDGLLSPSGNPSPERGQKRSMDHDDRDGRPTKGPRLSIDGGQGQFSRYPNERANSQWDGRGGIYGHGGMDMTSMGMNGGMNGNMGQMNGRRPPQGYQPPDPKKGLCRDYHNYGYCARGESCKYSHGEEAIIPGQLFPMPGQQMPGIGSQMPYLGMFQNAGIPFAMNGNVGGAYDPNEAHMDMRPLQQGQVGMGMGVGVGTGGSGVVSARSRAPILPRIQQEGGSRSQVIHNPNASGELPVIQDLTPKVSKDELQSQSVPQSQNGAVEEYGPEGGMFAMAVEVDESVPTIAQGDFQPGMRGESRVYSNGAKTMRPQKGRGDKTLVVEKIPEDKLSLDAVNGWFKRFGKVTHVAIDVRNAKALVTFSEHDEAHRAWKCEDAVFNNRFVKLFWHRPMEGHGQGGAKALAASASLVANINGKEPAPSTSATQPALTAPLPSTSPVKRKSTTQSVAAAALAAKQQVLEQQIAEQKSLMTLLMSAPADEKKEIMTRLRKLGEEMKPLPLPVTTAASSSSPALTSQKRVNANPQVDEQERKERERLDKELDYHSTVNQTESGAEENTEDLKAKLARLKAEAASLGLPEVTSGAPAHSGSYRPYRGRGRAARSYYRGATFRGAAPRASMKLDNRPKKLLIKGVRVDSAQHVRDWYETTGQVDSLETMDNGNIVVSFKSRSAAEQGLANGQNIPRVGLVQVSWYNGQPSAATMKSQTTSSKATSTEAKDPKTAGIASSHEDEVERHHSPHAEEEVVANGWGGDGDEDGMGML